MRHFLGSMLPSLSISYQRKVHSTINLILTSHGNTVCYRHHSIFPIYKGDEEVRREQDSIMTNYHPYFLLSENTGEKAISQFKSDYNRSLRKIIPDPTYSHHIERILKNVYEKGIIPVEQLGNLRKDSMRSIHIINKNTSILQSVSELYTTKRAYEELIYSDTLHYNKTLLQRCNLNNYLTPNSHV